MVARNYSYHNPGAAKGETDDSCCTLSCLKFMVYVYSLFSLATALTVFAIALWITIDTDQVLAVYSGTYTVLVWVILVTSIIIVFATVIGCCGISRESHGLMFLYTALCALVVLAQLSGGIAAYVYRNEIKNELVSGLNKTIEQEYGLNNATTTAVDLLQTRLECCGADSFEDWATTQWVSRGINLSNKVPDSCCKTVSRHCGVRDHPSNIYYTGCGERLSSLAANHLLLIGSAAVAIALVQIFGLIIALKLGLTMKKLENS